MKCPPARFSGDVSGRMLEPHRGQRHCRHRRRVGCATCGDDWSGKVPVVRLFVSLAHQPSQKFPLVHAVFESLTSVDKYHWDFVIELPSQFAITIHIHFVPRETAPAGELRKTLLHHLAKVTPFARIDHDLARLRHAAILQLALHHLSREKLQRPRAQHLSIPFPVQQPKLRSKIRQCPFPIPNPCAARPASSPAPLCASDAPLLSPWPRPAPMSPSPFATRPARRSVPSSTCPASACAPLRCTAMSPTKPASNP